jgi:hypothetical protein
MVSLVSLKYSLAGLAMKQGRPLTVRLPSGSSSFGAAAPTRTVACAPISIPPPTNASYAPLQVGALLVGSPGDLSVHIKAGLSRLAGMAGPALLTIGLSRVQHLSHLLSLRDADAEYIGLEEDLQDLPIEVSRPQQSEFGPPTQPLDLGSGVHSVELEAVAAAAAIAADAVVNGGNKKTNVLYNVDEGVEEIEDHLKSPPQFFLKKGDAYGMESFDNAAVNGKGVENIAHTPANGMYPSKNTISTTTKDGAAVATATTTSKVPLGPLLSYTDSPEMESAFIATEARVFAASDAAFCLLFLTALVCSVWASSSTPSHQPSWMACTLAFTAMLPFIASIASLMSISTTSFYIRHRETLLLLLILVPIVIARRGGIESDASVLNLLGNSTLPYLSADLIVAFFRPLGCRIRFCWLSPAQALNMASIIANMPWRQLQAAGIGVPYAVGLGCAGVLPLLMRYRCEVQARQRVAALLTTTSVSTTG